MCFMVVRRVTGELQCLYLRQPELFNPRLQHVFQSAVHLFGILHLKNQTETLRFNKSHRKLRHVAAGVTSRGQYSNIPVIWTGIRQDGSGEHLGSFTCAQTHLESTAQQSSFSDCWVQQSQCSLTGESLLQQNKYKQNCLHTNAHMLMLAC